MGRSIMGAHMTTAEAAHVAALKRQYKGLRQQVRDLTRLHRRHEGRPEWRALVPAARAAQARPGNAYRWNYEFKMPL
jgi:hypothetical protein